MWYNMLGCDNKEKIKAAEIVVFFFGKAARI